jgi:hypothetical protein
MFIKRFPAAIDPDIWNKLSKVEVDYLMEVDILATKEMETKQSYLNEVSKLKNGG